MVAQTHNPSHMMAERGGLRFKASLGKKDPISKNKLGMELTHVISATWKV
jgi:hypothetical protein